MEFDVAVEQELGDQDVGARGERAVRETDRAFVEELCDAGVDAVEGMSILTDQVSAVVEHRRHLQHVDDVRRQAAGRAHLPELPAGRRPRSVVDRLERRRGSERRRVARSASSRMSAASASVTSRQ